MRTTWFNVVIIGSLCAILLVSVIYKVVEQMEDTPSSIQIVADLSGGTTTNQYVSDSSMEFNDNIRYNSDNFDLTYHELNKYAGLYETNLKSIQVLDPTGHLVTLPYAPSQNTPVYYDPAQLEYRPFRPTYRDSVLLSHYRN